MMTPHRGDCGESLIWRQLEKSISLHLDYEAVNLG